MLSINSNSGAVQDLFYLGQAQGDLSTAMQRLSSGLQINSAADNPAGLAISAKMENQVSGLNQAVANAQTGISLLQTADGALSQSQSIVQQMRTLAVQAANGTLTPTDRATIQDEINQLANQLTSIAQQTQFNTKNLLDGSLQNINLQVGANANQTISFSIGAMDAKTLGLQTFQASLASGSSAATDFVGGTAPNGSALATGTTYTLTFAASTVAVTSTTLSAPTVPTGSALAGGTYSIVLSSDSYAYLIDANGNTVAQSTAQVAGDAQNTVITFADVSNSSQDDLVVKAAITLGNAPSSGTSSLGTVASTVVLTVMNGATTVASVTNPTASANGAITFMDATTATQADLVLQLGSSGLVMDSGASIGSLSLQAGGPNVLDSGDAQSAVTSLDNALTSITNQRALIGATQNRLQATIGDLQVTSQNLQNANGVIADANIPQEMMNFTQAQVKFQAGVSMLLQANAEPQLLLKIITG